MCGHVPAGWVISPCGVRSLCFPKSVSGTWAVGQAGGGMTVIHILIGMFNSNPMITTIFE